MREILFRGKRKDNGKWCEGDLFQDRDLSLFSINWFDYDYYEGGLQRDYCQSEVEPETIGQYTGLPDKHGKKIFEGDIVHCTSQMDSANCVVIFEEGEFRLVPVNYYSHHTTGCGYHAIYCFDKEVIGNIYDNPELLK